MTDSSTHLKKTTVDRFPCSESDELPKILPPKRRRNQAKIPACTPNITALTAIASSTASTSSTAGEVKHALQESLMDPASSAERIMREFPRHNWLEHKILQRSAYSTHPVTTLSSTVRDSAIYRPTSARFNGNRSSERIVVGRGMETTSITSHTCPQPQSQPYLQTDTNSCLVRKGNSSLPDLNLQSGQTISGTPHSVDRCETVQHNTSHVQKVSKVLSSHAKHKTLLSKDENDKQEMFQTVRYTASGSSFIRCRSSDSLHIATEDGAGEKYSISRRPASAEDPSRPGNRVEICLDSNWKQPDQSELNFLFLTNSAQRSEEENSYYTTAPKQTSSKYSEQNFNESSLPYAGQTEVNPEHCQTLFFPPSLLHMHLSSDSALSDVRERGAEDLDRMCESQQQTPFVDPVLPLDLCTKKTDLFGTCSRPRANLPVQMVLPQIQPRMSTSLSTSTYASSAPEDLISQTKTALKTIVETTTTSSASLTSRQDPLLTRIPISLNTTTSTVSPISSSIGSSTGNRLLLAESNETVQPDNGIPTVPIPDLVPAFGARTVYRLTGKGEVHKVMHHRTETESSDMILMEGNDRASSPGHSSTSSEKPGIPQSSPIDILAAAVSLDRTASKACSQGSNLISEVSLTSILDGGRRVNDDVSPEAVVADIDLDREFERHLREFREIERLAARKEQEREQVLALRKRKAEMLRQMEKKIKCVARIRGGSSASSASSSQVDPSESPCIVYDEDHHDDVFDSSKTPHGLFTESWRSHAENGLSIEAQGSFHQSTVCPSVQNTPLSLHDSHLSSSNKPLDARGRCAISNIPVDVQDKEITQSVDNESLYLSARTDDVIFSDSALILQKRWALSAAERRPLVKRITQAMATHKSKQRQSNGPSNSSIRDSQELKCAHLSSKESNPFIEVDGHFPVRRMFSPYSQRQAPLNEPPTPRAKQTLQGMPRSAHCQPAFQSAGSLIVPATLVDSQEEMNQGQIVGPCLNKTSQQLPAPVTPVHIDTPTLISHSSITGNEKNDKRSLNRDRHQGSCAFKDGGPAPGRSYPTSKHPPLCLPEREVIDLTKDSYPVTINHLNHLEVNGGDLAERAQTASAHRESECAVQCELSAAVAGKGQRSTGEWVQSNYDRPSNIALSRSGSALVRERPSTEAVRFSSPQLASDTRMMPSQPIQNAQSVRTNFHQLQQILRMGSNSLSNGMPPPGMHTQRRPTEDLKSRNLQSRTFLNSVSPGIHSQFSSTGQLTSHGMAQDIVGRKTVAQASPRNSSPMVERLPFSSVMHKEHSAEMQHTYVVDSNLPSLYTNSYNSHIEQQDLVLRNPMEDGPMQRQLALLQTNTPKRHNINGNLMPQQQKAHQQQNQFSSVDAHQIRHETMHRVDKSSARQESVSRVNNNLSKMESTPKHEASNTSHVILQQHQSMEHLSFVHQQQYLAPKQVQQTAEQYIAPKQVKHTAEAHSGSSLGTSVPVSIGDIHSFSPRGHPGGPPGVSTNSGSFSPCTTPLYKSGSSGTGANIQLSQEVWSPNTYKPIVPDMGHKSRALQMQPGNHPPFFQAAVSATPVDSLRPSTLGATKTSNRSYPSPHSTHIPYPSQHPHSQAIPQNLQIGSHHSHQFQPQRQQHLQQLQHMVVQSGNNSLYQQLQHYPQHSQQHISVQRQHNHHQHYQQQQQPQQIQQQPQQVQQQLQPVQHLHHQQPHHQQGQQQQQQQPHHQQGQHQHMQQQVQQLKQQVHHQHQQQMQVQTTVECAKTEGACELCGKHAMYLCSSCRLIWYCSQTCQTSHWATHSIKCKPRD